jgi:hypothetical protein
MPRALMRIGPATAAAPARGAPAAAAARSYTRSGWQQSFFRAVIAANGASVSSRGGFGARGSPPPDAAAPPAPLPERPPRPRPPPLPAPRLPPLAAAAAEVELSSCCTALLLRKKL